MHTIVAFASQKGGVGKSSLARAFARESALGGIDVRLADIDTHQGTSLDWSRTRLQNAVEPAVPVEAFGSAQHALARAQCDLLIIDSPAATPAETYEIAKRCDVLVQPSGACLDDLRPAVRTFIAMQKKGVHKKKLVMALTRIGTDHEADAAREYLSEAGITVLEGYLPEKPAYRAAQSAGRALTETAYITLNESAEQLITQLVKFIGKR